MALTIDELNIQITADSQAATNAVDGLIGGLERLKKTLNTFGSAGKKINKSFNDIEFSANKSKSALSLFGNIANNTSNSMKGLTDRLAQNISKWRTLFSVVHNVANKMGEWFSESNDYIETLNLFKVTMGDGADAAYEYAESVQKLMGVDIAEWMNYQGTFKNLTSGFGVVEKDANTMSQNLTQLSYDMASFFNTDVETAFDKLSSAMAGQVKGLRDFGIDVTVASLQEYALAKGIDKTVRSMTMAEKSMLRYNYIMEKSILMQGDMARTIATPSNALRILNAQLTQMKRALGNIVSVLVAKFIPYMQAMVEIITEAATRLANFLGFTLPEIDYSGLGSGFADEMEDAESSLEGAADTIKTIKKQLMGFDELNILNAPDADSGSGSSDVGGGGVLNMEPSEYDFLKGLDFNTSEIKERLKNALVEITTIASGFMLAIGLILALSGANIPMGLALIATGAAGLVTAITTNWDSMNAKLAETLALVTATVSGFVLALGAMLLFTGANVPLGIALLAAGVVGLATSFVIDWRSTEEPLKNTLVTLEGIVGGAFLALGAMLFFTGSSPALGVAFLAAGAVGLVAAATLNWDSVPPKVKGVVGTLTAVMGGASLAIGAMLAFTGVDIPLGIAFIAAGAISIVTAAILNWNSMSDKISSVTSIITGIVGGASLALGAVLAFSGVNIPVGVGMMAGGAANMAVAIGLNWDVLKEKLRSVLASILAIMSGYTAVMGILLCFTLHGIPLGLGLLFAAYKGTQAAMKLDDNPITNFVKKMINGIIKLVNKGVERINEALDFKIDGLTIGGVEIIPETDFKLFNIPKIPLLAEGGVVSAGQMFIAREAGPELVGNIGRKTAVANNDQIINGIYNGVYRAMMAANGGSGKAVTVNATFELDGEVVGRKVIKYHNGVVMQTGESPLLV